MSTSHRDEEEMQSHQCILPQKEPVIVDYIEAGWCIGFRRRFRMSLMVSDTNPRSLMFLRSTAAIRQERERHLQHYYYVIHPFSDFRAYWEYAMTLISLASLFIIPIQIMTAKEHVILTDRTLTKIELVADICCLTDVMVTFCTGYFTPNTKQIILNTRQIVRNYLFGYFFIDVISSLPLYMYFHTMNLISLLKVLRLFTLFKYVESIKEWKSYSNLRFKIFKLVLMFLLLIFWMGSIVFALAIDSEEDWAKNEDLLFRVLYCLYSATYCLLLVGPLLTSRNDIAGLYIKILGLILGVILKLYVLVQVMQVLQQYQCASNKYEQLHQELGEYVRYKEIPHKVKGRLIRYFEYKYQKHYYKESEIMGIISPQLRQEIVIAICRRFVENVDFFKDLPPSLIIRVVACLKAEVFLTNDVIVQAGITGDAMYFISHGTVAIYTDTGLEVCHLTDGTHFGEISLVMDEKRVASVIATTPCELYRLRRVDFQKAMEKYPEFLKRMRKLAQLRLQSTRKLEHEYSEEEKEIEFSTDKMFK